MFPIQIIIALLALVAVLALLAERLKLPYPILLVLGGLAISFIPGLPRIHLRPELIFLVILPPLLYYAGLLTTWRDFRANLRPILLLAVGLVLATTLAVGAVAHALIPDLPWAAALALGAIISPPDAIAATSITERLHVPRRIVTILEGESLVNDATALVALRFALAAAVASAGAFSLPAASLQFLWVAAGGIAIGLAVGYLSAWIICLIHQPGVAGTLALLTPFAAYLPAEALHVSGVLAVVATGLVMARRLPLATTARWRLRNDAVWDTLVFILNGLVFILIGLQLPSVMEGLGHFSFDTLCLYALAVSATAILVRIAWVFAVAPLTRTIPAIRRRDPMPPWRHVAIVSWAGMRGVVSLAAALALPHYTAAGAPFPGRDLIIFLSFSVILATLVLQGLTLPLLIRALRIRRDDRDRVEEREARIEAAHAALARLTALSFDDSINPEVIDRFRAEYAQRLTTLGARPRDGMLPDAPVGPGDPTPIRIQREVLIAQRRMITFLRDQDVIGDHILRRLLHEIDLEEARLSE
jgi:CPA1 family monovalent cation:H+ antiporter